MKHRNIEYIDARCFTSINRLICEPHVFNINYVDLFLEQYSLEHPWKSDD